MDFTVSDSQFKFLIEVLYDGEHSRSLLLTVAVESTVTSFTLNAFSPSPSDNGLI